MPFIQLRSNFRNLKFNSGTSYVPSTTPNFTTLLDLQTTLTGLKFGNDQPGYGSSNLPYIQTQIPGEPLSPGTFKPIFRTQSTGNADFPIRGGDINLQSGQQSFTISSRIDAERIKRFFNDAPRGRIFLEKQIGLQLTNPKIETGNVLFGLAQSDPLPGIIENTRLYNNGRNTLAQVRAMGSGAHALRHGLVPFAPFQKHYYAIVNQQNIDGNFIGTSQNRLVNLNTLKMTTGVSPFVNSENVFDISRINALGISLNRNLLFQYLGGPGSVYGAGSTTIPRVVDTTRLRSSTSMTYDQLKSQKVNNITEGKATTNIQDFRNQLPGLAGKYVPWIKTVDQRFYVSPGNYKDKLNKLYPFVFENSKAPWEIDKENTDDLIKFVFEAIDNDNPNLSTAIFFRAFLTAGITDNNSAQLNAFKYLGRGENFYTYQGFDRSIGFSFRIAAGSQEELRPIYNRLNTLISQVYPDYSPKTNIMRAPVVRVTIGDYIYRMPGFLESVNVTVDNNYSWEINQQKDQSGLIGELPQVLDVQVSFKPIMNELPRRASFTSTVVSTATNAGQETTTETLQIETNVPQLIANNDKIIYTNKSTQQSITRLATPNEISAQQDAILESIQTDIDFGSIENEVSNDPTFENISRIRQLNLSLQNNNLTPVERIQIIGEIDDLRRG